MKCRRPLDSIGVSGKPSSRSERSWGFQLSSLVCPWVDWSLLVSEWLAAQGHPPKLQAFINLRLGETWQPQKRDNSDRIGKAMAARKTYVVDESWEGTLVVGGCDVQADRIEVLIESWDSHGQSWFVAHETFRGDPSVVDGVSVWSELGSWLERHKVLALGVDTGGLATSSTYDASVFLETSYGVKVFALKGSSTSRDSFVPGKRAEATLVVAPATGRRVPLWIVDTIRGKEQPVYRFE